MTMIRTSWIIFAVTLVASLYALTQVPAGMELPIHWNLSGEVDRLVDAKYALLLMPAFILGIILLFTYVGSIDPRAENIRKSDKARRWIMLSVVVLFALLGAANIGMSLGYEFEMGRLVMSGVMLLLIVIGNFLPKLRSNYFIGIRLPWTLSSEENWRKTHYIGGRAFMICGAVGFLATLLIGNQEIVGYVSVALILSAVLIPVWYSWRLWRNGI